MAISNSFLLSSVAPTASPANSTRSKKKKGGAAETPAAATGGFPLADFELPSSVVVPPAAAPQRKTPSPPSTDSSFELVDADAVREAIEAEHQEPSKTSGASRRKNKKPTKSSLPAKVSVTSAWSTCCACVALRDLRATLS